jgi:fatty acid desaturase
MRRVKSRVSFRYQPQWLRDAVLLGNQFHYRQKNPLLHNTINFTVLGLILLAGLGLCYLSLVLPPLVFLVFGSVGFGLFHFMLFILVVHEASHNMFIIHCNSKNLVFWNRLFGWLVCIFYGIEYVKHWEVGHQVHHLEALTPHDPQNCPHTIYTGQKLWRYILIVLLVPGYFQFFRKYDDCSAVKEYGFNLSLLMGQIIFWVIFIDLATVYFSWVVPVAAFLGIQFLAVLNQCKIAMEHGGEALTQENQFLQSRSSFFPLRSIFMPLNISLHFEHHLNYCVPWYDLMKYHKEIKKVLPEDVQKQIFPANLQVWRNINFN